MTATLTATPTVTIPTPPSLESGSYTCTVCTKTRRNDYHVTSESHRNHGYNNLKQPPQGARQSSKGLTSHRNVGLSRQTGLTWHYSGLHTVLLLFMFICTIGSAVAQVDTTPSQVLSVLEGGTVTIPCTLSNVPPGVPIAWSAGNQIYFIDATHWHAPEPRFGIQARGTVYDLVLSGARREDDQVYECKRQDQLSTMTTHLTVMVLPDVPSITPDRNLPTEGDSIQLTCSSSQGNPPPTLHWFKGSTPITEGIVYTPTEFKFLATTSVLTRILSRDDHLAEYRCEAENGANQNTPRVGTYIMEVQYAPVVSFAQTSPYRVIRGSNALLECVVDANPQATITWETEEGERRGGTSMLTIQGADTDHAGGYRCRAQNDLGDSSDVIALEVHYSPTVTILVNNEQISIDQPSILNEHENVDLVCLVDSNPAPLAPVQWMHNGENIHSGDRLQYRPIAREATGTYMCVAENELAPTDVATLQGPAVQSGQATMQMLVQYRPSKANISGPRSATKGESATLRCNVAERGVPSASLNWTRASDQNTVLHTGSELQFSSVQLSDDGQYVCQPTNAVGDGPPDYYSLIVNERPEWLPVSGREGLPEERVINVTDTDVSLVCRARGRPAPSVTWYKDDVIIASNDPFYDVSVNEQRIDGISLDVTSTLHFRGPGHSGRSSLRIDDTGRYSCQVDSDISQTDLISRVDVVIQYAPVLNVSAEKIAIDMNDSALLECHAHSLPSAEFEWYKDQVRLFQGDHVGIMTEQVSSDGSRVTDTSEVTRHVSRLDIRSVSSQDLGRYTCLGKNLLGSNRATIDLMVKTVPDAPVRLSVTSSTWESVEVSWTHGFNGGYRQFFVVMYTSDSHGSGRHNIQIEDATRYNITGLFPSVNYTFRMFGVNELGSGTYSQQLQGSTNAFTIEPPTDVYYDEQTSVLSFRSPSTNYCVHVELYRDGEWSTYEGCENALGGSVELNQGGVQAARVKLCLKRRQQICSPPESAVIVEPPAEDLPVETIIIVACICGTIVVVLSIILIVLCCRRYKTTQKEQEADANRDTTVFHTQTSGGGPPNGRPSSPVKPTIKGIDNPAMDVDNLTLQEQYAIEGATTNQTDTSDYIRHDSLNPPQLTHYDSTYGTYNKNGYPGNGFTNSNGHLPQDPPPNYNEVSHMERNPSRLSARIDNNKVNNNNRSLSNVSDRRPKKRPSDMIDMDPPHDPTYDSSNNLHTNLPLRQYPPHGSDSGVSMPDPSSVKPKKVIYEVIV